MNKLLVASHVDLLVYDPIILNSISTENGDNLYIFLQKRNNLEKSQTLINLIKKFKLNIIFINDVEFNVENCQKLFYQYKNFIKTKNVEFIYVCNPNRLHCYICYLATSSLKKKVKFLYYQGSSYEPNGAKDHKIYSIFKNFDWLIKTKIFYRISRFIYFLRRFSGMNKIIGVCIKKIPDFRFGHCKLMIDVILNQGVPLDSIIAHDEIGLNSMLLDVSNCHNKNLKSDSFLLSNRKNSNNKLGKNFYKEIYLLPSFMFDATFSKKQTLLALDAYLELIDFIKINRPKLKIYAKMHPRAISSLEGKIELLLKNKEVEIIPRYSTLDQFLDKKSLLITDISSAISYCQINHIQAVSYQSKETCGHYYYIFNSPAYISESMFLIESKESIMEIIK